MKIFAIATAKNEVDVIEAFVRHTLAYCDGMVLINHGSTDETPRILEALVREGLPLIVLQEPVTERTQVENMTRALRTAIEQASPDWILCLDSDEFVQGAGVEALRQRTGPQTRVLRVPLYNYIADPGDDTTILNPVQRLRHKLEREAKNWFNFKIILPRALAELPGTQIDNGNHRFRQNGFEMESEILEDAWLAHFSLRNAGQYGTKLVGRILLHRTQGGKSTGSTMANEEPFYAMRRSFTQFQKNFTRTRISWDQGDPAREVRVCAPIDYRGGPLLHTPAQNEVDFLVRNTLEMSERIAVSIPQQQATAGDNHSHDVALTLRGATKRPHDLVQYFKSDTHAITSHRFPLSGTENPICFLLRTKGGLLEIHELTLFYDDDSRQSFTGVALIHRLDAFKDGLVVPAPKNIFARVLTTDHPLTVGFAGCESGKKPAAVELKVRFITDPFLLKAALFTSEIVGYFARMRSHPQALLNRKYHLGDTIQLNLFESLCFLEKGWRDPGEWGVWSRDPRCTLSFLFAEPTTRDLVFAFSARNRDSKQQNKAVPPLNVRITADGEEIAALVVDSGKYRPFEVVIPAISGPRRGLTLTFHLSAADGTTGNPEAVRIALREFTLCNRHRFKRGFAGIFFGRK